MDLVELYIEYGDKERLDSYIASELDDISRTYVHKLIKEGLVLVNGNQVKPRYLVKDGDIIQIKLPPKKELEPIPQNIDIDIIYEDEDIVLVNKPKGMVVHPAPGNYSYTLVNALLYHIDNLSSVSGDIRPGIVHRLDKDTSGLLIIAKNDEAHIQLVNQLKERTIKRIYLALVYGRLDLEGATVNAPIGRNPLDRKKMAVTDKNSKEAITDYKVLEIFKDYTLIEASLQTGRTHQIRVHMSYIKHPIVGDPVYTNRKNEFGIHTQLLHAKQIGFIHPRSGDYMEFESQPPLEFKKVVKILRERNR